VTVKGKIFPYRNVHKCTWTSDGNTIQYHILIDRRRHSSLLDIDLSGDQPVILTTYLVVAKVREKLPVRKQLKLRFHMGRFNIK
jgi:hypothetical protein